MAGVYEGGVVPAEEMEELQNTIVSMGVGHVIGANEAVRREFVENFKRALFPALGTSLGPDSVERPIAILPGLRPWDAITSSTMFTCLWSRRLSGLVSIITL